MPSSVNLQKAQLLAAELDEAESLSLLQALQDRWGWSGTLFTRADFEVAWKNVQEDAAIGGGSADIENPVPLTDELWEKAQGLRLWRRLNEFVNEEVWNYVHDAARLLWDQEVKP